MNISLTKELEKYLQKKVRTGLYTSVSEVVREAIRLLQEQDRIKATRFAEHRGEKGAGAPAPVDAGLTLDPALSSADVARTPGKIKKARKKGK